MKFEIIKYGIEESISSSNQSAEGQKALKQSTKIKAKRAEYLDSLRGIAALCVVIHHFLYMTAQNCVPGQYGSISFFHFSNEALV